MTYEEYNKFCGAFPATSYVVQWGNSHVWKVGGKVFAIGGWEKSDKPAFTLKRLIIIFRYYKNNLDFVQRHTWHPVA